MSLTSGVLVDMGSSGKDSYLKSVNCWNVRKIIIVYLKTSNNVVLCVTKDLDICISFQQRYLD